MESNKKAAAPRRRRRAETLPPISETVLRLRLDTNHTQATLARQVGLSVTTIARVEKGDLRISARNLERLLNFFGMSLSAVNLGPPSLSLGDADDRLAKW